MSPIEGFVVSRIDGSATTQDLADLTSLEPHDVERTIEKLIALGAVEWADGSMGLPRASLRPATPAEPIKRFSIPAAARPSRVRPAVTESVPPEATREPGTRAPSVQGIPAQSSFTVSVETVEATDRMPSAVRADGASSVAAPGARVGLRTPSGERAIDDIDLTAERRARIDALYPMLELLDHYEALGLRRDADTKAVRASYFELSKVFHPDTAFRKNLGPYKAKMEAIFTRLTEAYDVLGKKKARAEYDAYLGVQVSLREAEAVIGPADPDPIAPAPPAATPSPSPSPPPPPSPSRPPPPPPSPSPSPSPPPPSSPPDAPRTMSDEGKRRARELFQKRLGGAIPARTPTPPVPAPPSEPAAPRARQDVLRDLTSSLKGAAAATGGLDPVQRHVLEARRHESAGDLASAVKELRLAVALAPDRFEVTSEQQRVSKLLAIQLADQYAAQADYEERHRKWAAAAVSWGKVVDGRPEDAVAHARAAHALLEAKGDLHKAQRLAQRACDLAPDHPLARRTLGRVFLAAGLQLNARRELERAASLDPSDPIVKNLLRDMKG